MVTTTVLSTLFYSTSCHCGKQPSARVQLSLSLAFLVHTAPCCPSPPPESNYLCLCPYRSLLPEPSARVQLSLVHTAPCCPSPPPESNYLLSIPLPAAPALRQSPTISCPYRSLLPQPSARVQLSLVHTAPCCPSPPPESNFLLSIPLPAAPALRQSPTISCPYRSLLPQPSARVQLSLVHTAPCCPSPPPESNYLLSIPLPAAPALRQSPTISCPYRSLLPQPSARVQLSLVHTAPCCPSPPPESNYLLSIPLPAAPALRQSPPTIFVLLMSLSIPFPTTPSRHLDLKSDLTPHICHQAPYLSLCASDGPSIVCNWSHVSSSFSSKERNKNGQARCSQHVQKMARGRIFFFFFCVPRYISGIHHFG